MVGLMVYVEGGSKEKSSKASKTEARRSFTQFLEKAGLKGKMPRITACGGRKAAYDYFCTAMKQGHTALLLVDSEEAVDPKYNLKPWAHLAQRKGDGWSKPPNATDEDCHLMVQVMETWFLADKETLEKYYGQKFNSKIHNTNIENVNKKDVYDLLENATKDCQKGRYDKGDHSFQILREIDPEKVTKASSWAERFVNETKKRTTRN